MTEGPIFHIEITAATLADLKAFTDEIPLDDLGCRPVVRRRGAELSSTPTYRKHNSTRHAGRAPPALYHSRLSRM